MLYIDTDHLNNATNNTTSDCTIQWLNYIEQLNPYIHFIPGKDNVISNMLSWLDHLKESVLSKDKQVFVLKNFISNGMDFSNDLLLIKFFFLYHPSQSRIQIQPTINGYLWNTMKLMN